MTLITIAAARYSSEDAAVLVEYVLSIVEYTLLCGPLKYAIERVGNLESMLEEMKKAEQEEQKVGRLFQRNVSAIVIFLEAFVYR